MFPTKAQAMAALALLRAIAKKEPALRARCVATAIEALSNPAENVQAAVLDLVEAFPHALDEHASAEIARRLEDVAPTQRARAAGLAKGLAAPIAAPAIDHGSIEQRLARLEPGEAERWGIAAAAAAVKEGRGWAPARVVPAEADFIPLQPIASPEELLECIAQAVELVSGADEVERIIDGIARFSDWRPESKVAETVFARLTAPTSSTGLTSSMGLPGKLVQTVAGWFARGKDFASRWHDEEAWWAARFDPYLARIARRRQWQPLASPTHRGGWIDARVLVVRIASSDSVDDSDFIQAMLRLAPFGREEALRRCGALTGKWRDLVEFALGGELRIGLTDMLRAPLWVAAGRARQPHGELVQLARLPGVAAIPDAIHESRVELTRNDPDRSRYGIGSEQTPLKLDPSFDADIARKVGDFPQCGFYPRAGQLPYMDWLSGWIIEWRSQTWPANTRGFMYSGINRMLQRFEMGSSAYEPNYVFVEALRPITKPLGPLEVMALGIACMSGEQEVRRSASEVLARAALEGRIDADALGASLLDLHGKGWSSVGRLAKSLGTAAGDSPKAAHLVVATLSRFIAGLDDVPKGGHDLLEVLYQQAHRLGVPVDQELGQKLEGIKGKTKTGRLAQQLVNLKGDVQRASSANAEALERLLAIAESVGRPSRR
jgi:hypothetical protein